jgi:cyclophilin family peptidyl-prolyl cis-trans isomerase/HEAT repeat protein
MPIRVLAQLRSCSLRRNFLTVCAALILSTFVPVTKAQRKSQSVGLPKTISLRILKAEDERRWDQDLAELLKNPSAEARKRALLAAGRIGDERAVPFVVTFIEREEDPGLRAMAAFALGEIESPVAIEALAAHLGSRENAQVRARAVEALGKIAAALPKTEGARANAAGKAILEVLEFEAKRRSAPDKEVILLALTAALRARPDGAGKVIAEFLTYSDPRIRADAGNALARLRTKDGNQQLRKLLTSDPDPIVRANAARVLGATEDKESLDALADRATTDRDLRVRVSAVRSLAALKDPGVMERLIKYTGVVSSTGHRTLDGVNTSNVRNTGELLEIASAIGRLLQGTENSSARSWLEELRWVFGGSAQEIEIALVRVSPKTYLNGLGANTDVARLEAQRTILTDWRAASALAQGLAEIAALPDSTKDRSELGKRAIAILGAMLDYRNSGLNINTLVAVHSEYAIPDVLRAYAAFKPADLAAVLRNHLKETDAVTRATAAELLGELPPVEENANALIAALHVALKDEKLNDAALATIDALAKQKTSAANKAIKSALKSDDHLVHRRAVVALKTNSAGDFSSEIGGVQTRNRLSDYERALARADKRVLAIVKTNKGNFTIELLPADAPLTVDNFVQLARRGYFNRIIFHRVVPNFVIQGGDPRGDGNGGPGYSIRCEINMVPYDRGAVGMALSGKDTGGSQWLVTHSPQPHLDGGYTVFGRVVNGMGVVDTIVRGDSIVLVSIREEPRPKKRVKR